LGACAFADKLSGMARRALSDKTKQGKGGGCAAVLFGLVFAGAGAAMLVFMTVLPLARMAGAGDWRPVPATVVSSSVTTHSDSAGTTYGVEIEYRYEVNGRSYTSDRRSFGMSGSSSGRSGKEKFVADHPPGKQVTCYVDPDDPTEAVLNKGLSWSLLWGLFPLPFLLIGVFVLWFGVRGLLGYEKKSSWRAKSAGVKADSDAVPTLDAAADDGPVVLRPGKQRLGGAVALLVFALIWNGIISIFLFKLFQGYRAGAPDVCFTLFMVPFVLAGLFVLWGFIHQVMLVFAPVIELELDRAAVPVGGAITLKWHVPGRRGRLTSLTIDLIGEEKATYRRGTDTITDTHVFCERRLAGADDSDQTFDTLPTLPDRGSVVVDFPAETMHTFKADNNKIEWSLKVCGVVPRWPDTKDRYEVTVLPMRLG